MFEDGAAVVVMFIGDRLTVAVPESLKTVGHGFAVVHMPPDVTSVRTSDVRNDDAWPAVAAPLLPVKLLMTRNIGELQLRSAEPHEVAARSAAAVSVRVMMRMRVIVLPTTPS